jgi:hypothetical protein
MPITQFTDAVEIEGSQDISQLTVQGHTTQTEPLQTWQSSAEDVLSRVTGDGRFQVGDDLGMATPDSLIEAHRDAASLSLPQRGLHTLGRIAGILSDAVQWAVHELELVGSEAISGIHSALRARAAHSSEGDSTATELRAGDFVVSNQTGAPTSRLGRVTALHAEVTNATDGYLDEAVGINIAVHNDNSDETDPPINAAYGVRIENIEQAEQNYALHTGKGTVHLGDALELPIFEETPDDNPPEGFLKVYPKIESTPKLFAKDEQGAEHELLGGLPDTYIVGVRADYAPATYTGLSVYWDGGDFTHDTENLWAGVGDASKFIAPETGFYAVHLQVEATDASLTTPGLFSIHLFEDNTSSVFAKYEVDFNQQSTFYFTISGGVFLEQGNYVQVGVDNPSDDDVNFTVRLSLYRLF